MGRLVLIGDVHGMMDELKSLISKLQLDNRDGDRVIFLGDLVDKGPKPISCLMLARMVVRDFPGSGVVCGNHEETTIRAWDRAQRDGWDKVRRVDKEPWIRQLTPGTVDWMRTFPLFLRPRPDVIAVHGGLFPTFFRKHGAMPDECAQDWHKGGGKLYDRMRRFLRVREVFDDGATRETKKGTRHVGGEMVQLGDEGDDTRPWAERYDGREGFAFYGHAPTPDGLPVVYPHAIGLDTGAVFGRKLTAAVIPDGARPRDAEFVSVNATKHAEPLPLG